MIHDRISVGAKLPLAWQRSEDWIELPSDHPPHVCLSELGFDYVEYGVGNLLDSDEPLLLQSESQCCSEANLGVSMHPYLGGHARIALLESRPQCKEAIHKIFHAAHDATQMTGQPAKIVFHPAEDEFDPDTQRPSQRREELLRISQRFARFLDKCASAAGPLINVLLEHQVPPAPGENIIRIGDTARELLNVVGHTNLGVCWDTGHYLLSVQRHDQPIQPPDAFVERVQHIHLHDVRDGRDHRPISSNSNRLRKWIQTLWNRKYAGNITLEYESDAVRASGGIQPVATESFEILNEWLKTA